jgi:hypothetical protein
MKREEWLASNPAVQEAVDEVRGSISRSWSRILDENVCFCRFQLEHHNCSTAARKGTFLIS